MRQYRPLKLSFAIFREALPIENQGGQGVPKRGEGGDSRRCGARVRKVSIVRDYQKIDVAGLPLKASGYAAEDGDRNDPPVLEEGPDDRYQRVDRVSPR